LKHLGFLSVSQALDSVGHEGWGEAELHVIPPLLQEDSVISLGENAPLISEIKHALGAIDVVFNLNAHEDVLHKRVESNSLSRLARLPHYAIIGTCGVDTSGDIKISERAIRNFLERGHQIPKAGPHPIF
jgi:hypothetical protein